MMNDTSAGPLLLRIAGVALSLCVPAVGVTQTAKGLPAHRAAVLVELFTSEGCSSCPPADALLRQVAGQTTAGGQLVIALSEHVSYWDGLGWKDPFSSELYTTRQNEYGRRFGLDSVFTPQMVVNGRQQFVGNDRHLLESALATEARHKQIELHIDAAQIKDGKINFSYSSSGLPANHSLVLVAALTDDTDHSSVLHGENAGRSLIHTSVARALVTLGPLREVNQVSMSIPLPSSFNTTAGTGHHLVLFAQESGAGTVTGIDTTPISF